VLSVIRQQNIIAGSNSPLVTDFPSIEGFGYLLLASLTQKEDTVVPPNLSHAVPFQWWERPTAKSLKSSAGSYRQRSTARTYSGFPCYKRENADKLPALAERNGWRYNVKGRLLGSTGIPIKGALVVSTSRVNCTTMTVEAPRRTRMASSLLTGLFRGTACSE